jgi:single-stranded-DNA-specific exonuclease
LIKSKYRWKKQIEGVVEDKDVFEYINKNRDILDHEAFFSMGIESIHDPFLFKDMQRSVDRIKTAIKHKENILIFGDYDCDGITSVSIMYRILDELDANVSFQIPDRFSDGYGMNMALSQQLVKEDVQLVITVDNGISSVEEINYIQSHGIDVIVTDHHQFKEELPKAYAILHTVLSPDYPFKDIAGCMVAFKLAWALKGEFPQDLTDLAMIGTIADLMPLENENQAMVNIGLEQLKKTENIGLRKILTHSHLEIINQTAIAFQIAPKINSSGRLNQAPMAVELLITNDIRKANELIVQIDENHEIRKRYTEQSFKIAEKLIDGDDQVLVLVSPKFHEGVLGICAQRISEKYQKPTIVMVLEDGYAKGSARSFGQISILNMLKKADDLLEKYGGHNQAAGMQIKEENIDAFRERLNNLDIDDSEPELLIDMEVDINHISKETIQRLQNKSFHTALFLMKDLRVLRKQIIGKKHLKLTLETNHQTFDALKFNQTGYFYNLNENDVIDVCGGLTINRFRNKESIQIMLTDLRCSHIQVMDFRQSYQSDFIQNQLFDDYHIIDDEIILNTNDLKRLMTGYKSYALFPKSSNHNLNILLDRNEIVKVYIKLKKRQQFDIFDIMKAVGVDEWTAKKLISIFKDLDLIVDLKNGFGIQERAKTDLTVSKTYQDLLAKKKTIDWLYQSTIERIKKYLEDKNGL